MSERKCGDCQLCCKLLPTKEISKPANTRCQHQKTGKGCGIYTQRPWSCRLWNCRWLLNDDTADLSRPDRSHYVIDVIPDYIQIEDNVTGELTPIPVLQIWIDPAFPDAHRDPHLRAYLARRGATDGMAALIRNGSNDAFVLFPPALASDGKWHEEHSNMREGEHSLLDMAAQGLETRLVFDE